MGNNIMNLLADVGKLENPTDLGSVGESLASSSLVIRIVTCKHNTEE